MKQVLNSGLSGFILGLAIVLGVVVGGLGMFFFLKWYLAQIDLKSLIINMVLR